VRSKASISEIGKGVLLRCFLLLHVCTLLGAYGLGRDTLEVFNATVESHNYGRRVVAIDAHADRLRHEVACYLERVLLHGLALQKLLSSQIDALFACEAIEETVGGQDDKFVARSVNRSHADLWLAQHEVTQRFFLCFFVLYCDLLALKVSKRASYSESTEYASEDNIAALALDSLLFVLATRLEVLAELDAAALAAHNRPGVAQVRTDQLVADYEANDSR